MEAISGQIAPNPNYARVIVQQEQMIRYANKTLPTNRTITAEEAEEINLTSAAIIYAVGEKFKQMGHKVSLFAHSFGSFVVPEMLLVYGDEPFQKILISAGRLDMPEAIRQNISAGKAAGFDLDEHNIATKIQLENQTRREDVEFQIRQDAAKFGGFCSTASKKENPMAVLLCTGNSVDESKKEVYINIELNMFRLMVDSDKPRYTKLLKNKLNKVIYYFGGQDTRVGSLTVREVNALAGKSAASDAGIGSIKFLTPDGSKSVTRNIKLEGQTTPTNVTRTVYTINDTSGQPAVRYTLEDGHSLPLLFQHTLDDILKSFGAK